jgi:hypothetical protein
MFHVCWEPVSVSFFLFWGGARGASKHVFYYRMPWWQSYGKICELVFVTTFDLHFVSYHIFVLSTDMNNVILHGNVGTTQ